MHRGKKRDREQAEEFDLAQWRKEFLKTFQQTMADIKPSKTVDDMITAIKLDIVTAIREHAAPLVLMQEMVTSMKDDAFLQSIQALLKIIDSGYGDWLADDYKFSAGDHKNIFYFLLKAISDQFEDVDKIHATALQEKRVVKKQLEQEAQTALKNLGCNKKTRRALIKRFENNLYQFNMLNGDYNTRLVQTVQDQQEKQALILRLIEVGSEAKTKRQRFDMCPANSRGPFLAWLQDNMSELEFLYFNIEGVDDDLLVMETIKENSELFESGVDVADCCKVVPPHLQLWVLSELIDEDSDALFIVNALNGVSIETAKRYIKEVSKIIENEDEDALYEMIRMTDEGSALERMLLRTLKFMPRSIINNVLNRLYAKYGADYIINCLAAMPWNCIDGYDGFIIQTVSLFNDASEGSLRTLFRMIWQNTTMQDEVDENVIETLSAIAAQSELMSDDDDDPRMEHFDNAFDRYLSCLLPGYRIAVIHGVYTAGSAGDYEMLDALSSEHKNLYLRAKATTIASDFSLVDILELCNGIVKTSDILNSFSGQLERSDIALLENLVRQRKVTKTEVRHCVQRCYKKYIETQPQFALNETMNVLLVLLAKYSMTEFRKVVRPEFRKMVARNYSYMKSVLHFPVEVRMEVLLSSSGVCSPRELRQLGDLEKFPAEFNPQKHAYLKRALQLKAKDPTASSYMQEVFNLDADDYLAYCASLKDFNGHTVSFYLGVTKDNHTRVKILCAIGHLITMDMYRSAVVQKMVTLTHQDLKKFSRSGLREDVARLVSSQFTDTNLTNLIQAKAPQSQISQARAEIKPLPIITANQQYQRYFQRVYNANDMIQIMSELLETERFEFVMECTRRSVNLFLSDNVEHRVVKVQSVIALLPIPYQRLFAEQMTHLFTTTQQINSVAAYIADERERKAFVKTCQSKPAAGIIEFNLFKPKTVPAAAVDAPQNTQQKSKAQEKPEIGMAKKAKHHHRR